MSVSQYCRRNPITIGTEATAHDAAKRMREQGVGTLVVVAEADGKSTPLGLLNEGALVNDVLAVNVDPSKVLVTELMQKVSTCAQEDEPIWTVIEQMRAQHQRRLPVVDAENHLVGLLAADDIFELITAGMIDIATLMREPRTPVALPKKRPARKRPARRSAKKSDLPAPEPETPSPPEDSNPT